MKHNRKCKIANIFLFLFLLSAVRCTNDIELSGMSGGLQREDFWHNNPIYEGKYLFSSDVYRSPKEESRILNKQKTKEKITNFFLYGILLASLGLFTYFVLQTVYISYAINIKKDINRYTKMVKGKNRGVCRIVLENDFPQCEMNSTHVATNLNSTEAYYLCIPENKKNVIKKTVSSFYNYMKDKKGKYSKENLFRMALLTNLSKATRDMIRDVLITRPDIIAEYIKDVSQSAKNVSQIV